MVVKNMDIGAKLSGMQSQGNHFLAGRPEASYLIGLCLSLFICKLGMIIKPMIHRVVMKVKSVIVYKVIRGERDT